MSTIEKPSYYKYCLVPCCTNTSVTTPDKMFLCVPRNRRMRDIWTKAMKRDTKRNPFLSASTTHWCCEDHFSLEEDLENYWQWKLTKNVKRMKLRDGVVPHRFECQKKNSPLPVQKGALKRKRIALLQAALSAIDETISGETESLKVDETSPVIKQEPVESVDEPPRLVIEQIQGAEEIASSKSSLPLNSSSFSSGSVSFQEKASPLAKHDSSIVDAASAGHIAKKPIRKRKRKGEPTTSDAALVKSYRVTKPSSPSKLSPRAPIKKRTKSSPSTIPSMQSKWTGKPQVGTAKKSAGGSTLPTKIDENATREMFESLIDSSENNPLFDSRTTKMPGDLFDVFADLIANKLREMEWDDCAFALRAILKIVFKAGKVQHDSEVE